MVVPLIRLRPKNVKYYHSEKGCHKFLHFPPQCEHPQPQLPQQQTPDFFALRYFLQRDFTINDTTTNKITLTITVPISFP